MEVVSRKSEVKKWLDICLEEYHSGGVSSCVDTLGKTLLNKKVKFPLLEFCGNQCHQNIDEEEQLVFCDRVELLKTEGGNVLLGIILQKRLPKHFASSVEKATEYISRANAWYVCDIIGERVYGFALLSLPEKTIPAMVQLSKHPSPWVVRAMGAGIHYAIKKGADKGVVRRVFILLLTRANAQNKEIRQGIGWAAKTTARFHPDIIRAFDKEIQSEKNVANWFRRKVDIGLKRSEYAQRN